MCILLYLKLISCNGFPEIYGQLEEGGMESVCTGVVVFHTSIVIWRWGGVNLPLAYVHSVIYETSVV